MSSIYEINVPYSGYVRGVKVVTVEAESQEDALESVKNGNYDEVSRCIVTRDDSESDYSDAYL